MAIGQYTGRAGLSLWLAIGHHSVCAGESVLVPTWMRQASLFLVINGVVCRVGKFIVQVMLLENQMIVCGLQFCTLCLKNVPTLASCSFDKHGLILTIFDKQHQHTFQNDKLIQLSLPSLLLTLFAFK